MKIRRNFIFQSKD